MSNKKILIFYFSGGGGNFVLSTSFLGFTTCLGGCAAMVKDGYGCFYNIEPKRLVLVFSIFLKANKLGMK